ncbi:MAG: hypothetical protein WCH01_14965 [Methylococcaceae bacterium]
MRKDSGKASQFDSDVTIAYFYQVKKPFDRLGYDKNPVTTQPLFAFLCVTFQGIPLRKVTG